MAELMIMVMCVQDENNVCHIDSWIHDVVIHCCHYPSVFPTYTYSSPMSSSQVTTSNTRNGSRKSVVGEGRCDLLACLPHPASLLPSPGAHLFVIKIGDSTIPPPTFTPTLGEGLKLAQSLFSLP